MKQLLWIALGGAIGASLRFGVSQLLKPDQLTDFPIHTLVVNIVGCFFIGLLFFIPIKPSSDIWIKSMVITGILGGFTTFSAFGLETLIMLTQGKIIKAVIYILISNLAGLLSVYAGYYFSKSV